MTLRIIMETAKALQLPELPRNVPFSHGKPPRAVHQVGRSGEAAPIGEQLFELRRPIIGITIECGEYRRLLEIGRSVRYFPATNRPQPIKNW